jgi:hypothetical protein
MFFIIIFIIVLLGCFGGICSAYAVGEREQVKKGDKDKELRFLGLYYENQKCETTFLTLRGHIVLGGITSIVFWIFKGPIAQLEIIPIASNDVDMVLAVEHIGGAIASGFVAPGLLGALALQLCRLNK